MEFEWDPEKDSANRRKHGLSFEEASELFLQDVDYVEIFDESHSEDEERFIAVGPIRRGVIVVVHTEPREETIRIISARLATRSEVERFRTHRERK